MDNDQTWYVYLLSCADGTLYCGVTNDVDRRLAAHNAGTGAKYTRCRLPVSLAASAPFADRSSAQKAEYSVKRKRKDKKIEFLHKISERMKESAGLAFSQHSGTVEINTATSGATTNKPTLMTDVEPYRGKITKDEINELPLAAWKGEIDIIETLDDAEDAIAELAKHDVLGFDTESRPAFRKGKYYLPSLIQIGTDDRVFIFMLSKMPFPEKLKDIFENVNILKTGVAVRDDVKDLQKISHFEPKGFIDLGVVALNLKLETHGLRNLAAKFLGIRISKSARCTNWANPNLSRAQINYAATDAWISRELYLAMNREGLINPATDFNNGNGTPKKNKRKCT